MNVHIRKKEDFTEFQNEKRVKKCKRCHGRGYEGQYVSIGGENVGDNDKYKTCICVENVIIKRQQEEFKQKIMKEMEKRLKKKHEEK